MSTLPVTMTQVAAGLNPRPIQALRKYAATRLGNYWHELSQDHVSFKLNAVIVSSLLLVTARAIIALDSARKAKNTPEGPYRQMAAYVTIVREYGGWFLSYGLFNMMTKGLKRLMRNTLLDKQKVVGRFGKLRRDLWAQVKNWWKGSPIGEISSIRDVFQPALKPDNLDFGRFNQAYIGPNGKKWLTRLICAFVHNAESIELKQLLQIKDKPKDLRRINELLAKRVEKFYTFAPLIVGAVVSVLLSGWALEWFSINYFDTVKNMLTQWNVARKKRKMQNMPAGQEWTMPASHQQRDFKNFLSSIEQKQRQRTAFHSA